MWVDREAKERILEIVDRAGRRLFARNPQAGVEIAALSIALRSYLDTITAPDTVPGVSPKGV